MLSGLRIMIIGFRKLTKIELIEFCEMKKAALLSSINVDGRIE